MSFSRAEQEYLTPPDPQLCLRCEHCEADIYVGSKYYIVLDYIYCENCVEERVADMDE